MTVPNAIQIANGKKASLSTSLTNLYATKLILQWKKKKRIDLSKVTSENTRAPWPVATQMI